MELALFIGIPASGKSTFYRRRLVDTHLRLDLDMLRTRHREQILFDACLRAKQAVVIDNCNATAAERARYIAPARTARFTVVGYYFRARITDALARNAARLGRARIPDVGVRGTHARLEVPTLDEGFDALWYVSMTDDDFRVEAWDP